MTALNVVSNAKEPARAMMGAPRQNTIAQNWIAVASAEHVRRGRAGGFMQVCHGKAAPLRRIHQGDYVAYYSPTVEFRGRDKCQAFTSLGIVRDRPPYQPAAEDDFCPHRRDVIWLETHDAPIGPLVDALEFTAGKRNWGCQLRFGLFCVSAHDMRTIAAAMGIDPLPN